MLKHYVEYVSRGIIVSESSWKEIPARDDSLVAMSDWSFGYRFFDREVVMVGGEVLEGERKNFSPWTYRGEIWDIQRAKRETGDDSALVWNMEHNSFNKVVRTSHGQCIPLREGDRAIND